MKKLTKRYVVNDYLTRAGGDPLKALKWAVEDLGRVGYSVSAGYVRAAPFSDTAPPHAIPPSVDIPEQDGDDDE